MSGRDDIRESAGDGVDDGGTGGLEERLLHGLLSDGSGDPGEERDRALAELGAGPDGSRRLEELEGFLATCRAGLVPMQGPSGEEDLVRRILERTTRRIGAGADRELTDPGWRGDLRLVKGFMAARWKASFVLRVAAASLMLHLAAIPLLAYFGLGGNPPEFKLTFTPRFVPDYGDSQEPEHQVEAELLGELPEVRDVPDLDELEVQNALQWARFHLLERKPPAGAQTVGATGGIDGVSRMLAQRGSYLGARGSDEPASDVTWALGHPSAVVRAITVEHLLDRFVLERQRPQGLTEGLLSLRADGELHVRALEVRALLRAKAYGLLDQVQTGDLEGLLVAQPETARGWDPLAPHAPLDRGYLEALGLAAGEALAGDPTLASWLRWRE